MNEFEIINKYFANQIVRRKDVILGIGDDAAIVQVPEGHVLLATTDTLVEGVHFQKKTLPFDIGYKSLAVNLSDLAAMGAEPCWMTLAITMPEANKKWLQAFSCGLFQLAEKFNIALIGGDTTRGPLTITIHLNGYALEKNIIRRDTAHVGDQIYVSGTLGDAGLGLEIELNNKSISNSDAQFLLSRLNRPTPRIELGLALRGIATSAIDISDGLLADLQHILDRSNVGATIAPKHLPLSSALIENLSLLDAQKMALIAGDDYELCFTVPKELEDRCLQQAKQLNIPVKCIGEIEANLGLRLKDYSEKINLSGYKHF